MDSGRDRVTVVDATPDRWDGVATVMGTRGDPSRCWCQYFLFDGNYLARSVETNRAALRRQVRASDPPLGVLAYLAEESMGRADDEAARRGNHEAVGWCGVAPRSRYPRLSHSQVALATADEDGLWSVTCFVVRTGFRRRGVGTALLAGALDLARRSGARSVEAYPVDTAVKKSSSAGLYVGALSLFERAGFVEVARPTPSRAVVRLAL